MNSFLNNLTNHTSQQNTVVYNDYPEVFFTSNYKQEHNIKNPQNIPQQPNNRRSFGISKDMIGQIMPMLFGKQSGGMNNIFSGLMQNFMPQSGNASISELLSKFNVLNTSQLSSKKTEDKKNDSPTIIDMSEYKEL